MRTFHVKNFERFQHYRDRDPPWIKLYNSLLEDYGFACLPDTAKWHLCAIWLLASRTKNRIPCDAEWLRGRLNASSPVDLQLLLKSGFIELDQDCSGTLARSEQDASKSLALARSREAETEGETETDSPPLVPPRGGNDANAKQLNGANGHAKRERGTRLPPDWVPSADALKFADELGLDGFAIADKFRDYWHGAAGSKGIKLSWDATWRNWCRREAEQRPRALQRNGPATGIAQGFADALKQFRESDDDSGGNFPPDVPLLGRQ